jgi:hypothetical protein
MFKTLQIQEFRIRISSFPRFDFLSLGFGDLYFCHSILFRISNFLPATAQIPIINRLTIAHPQMSFKIMGTSVSFQFRNEQFCAKSRTILQDSGIGSAEGRPARARGMDALSQHKGLRGGVQVVRRTSNPED